MFKSFISKEQYTYVATYVKGKNSRNPSFRFLLQDSNGNKCIFFIHEETHPMFGTDFAFIDDRCYKTISDTHIRFKNYNYYLLDINNDSLLTQELERFKSGRKLFWTGRQGEFDRTYRATFEFNGIKY